MVRADAVALGELAGELAGAGREALRIGTRRGGGARHEAGRQRVGVADLPGRADAIGDLVDAIERLARGGEVVGREGLPAAVFDPGKDSSPSNALAETIKHRPSPGHPLLQTR